MERTEEFVEGNGVHISPSGPDYSSAEDVHDGKKQGLLELPELLRRVAPRHENLSDIAEEAIGFAATVGRYALTAFPMTRRARRGESILGHGVAAIVADVWDGELTRRMSRWLLGRAAEDTPFRRITDGVLDQATVFQVGYEVAKRNPSARPYLAAITVRSIVAGGGLNGVHMLTTGEVTKGRNWQRATNITAGIFGIAAASGNRTATNITGVIASAVAWGTAPIHYREFRQRKNRVFREL